MTPTVLLTGGAGSTASGRPLCGVPETYARAVEQAGGLPTLALSDDGASCAAKFDGLLLTGGVDADPAQFGESPLFSTLEMDAARDHREKSLFDAFLAVGKPIFGICRGIQMLVVFLGGTLWQDLPAQCGLSHSGDTLIHTVCAKEMHWLSRLLGHSFSANSFHHQAIRTLPPGLNAVAHTDDGIIEAVELTGAPVWGVQWHPERMTGGILPNHAALFERFVTQCMT